jgi:F-type H+-transporting ATPase subunit c
MNWIKVASVLGAALAVGLGAIGPGLGEGRAAALDAIARQPEAAATLSRTLFVGLAMIETMAIYCLVIALLPKAVIRAGILAAVTRWPPRD